MAHLVTGAEYESSILTCQLDNRFNPPPTVNKSMSYAAVRLLVLALAQRLVCAGTSESCVVYGHSEEQCKARVKTKFE